eukprot:CAMPEP_0196724558 /NCGR_PEP_ID=MMETSP1091-20130531/6359_1 /TAXON_ID=302021 /ORGANISM="Rhodomonas sp., Strain CCMP768" /LENGTH=50 /DNA_ID=CAMNT_0042066689 /DNA_START=84 /DNA_END=233 /DNA_ORIENTATION=-
MDPSEIQPLPQRRRRKEVATVDSQETPPSEPARPKPDGGIAALRGGSSSA